MHRIILSLGLFFLVAAAMAEEADFDFKSLGARKAVRDYKATLAKEDKAKQKAMKEMEAEAKKAQKKYRVELIMNLEQALKKALQDADLEEANKIDAAIKALKKGASPAGGSTAGSKGRKSKARIPKKSATKARIPRDAVKWNGHHYMIVPQRLTAQGAMIWCLVAGGHLIQIESKDEHNFVRRMLSRNKGTTHYWVDGSDAYREGEWRFSNGKIITYNGWGPGEGKAGSKINQMALWGSVNWSFTDDDGSVPFYFICEWDE